MAPERLAHADLARPLGYADQHDVHDDDAAHDQGDGCDSRDNRAEIVQHCCEQILECGAGVDGERVFHAGRKMALRPHDGAQFV